MSRPRVVIVTFINHEGLQLVEPYGPFNTSEELVAWLDQVDENLTFGGHADMAIRYLGVPSVSSLVSEPAKSKTTKKTATKKAVGR